MDEIKAMRKKLALMGAEYLKLEQQLDKLWMKEREDEVEVCWKDAPGSAYQEEFRIGFSIYNPWSESNLYMWRPQMNEEHKAIYNEIIK